MSLKIKDDPMSCLKKKWILKKIFLKGGSEIKQAKASGVCEDTPVMEIPRESAEVVGLSISCDR